MTELPDERLTDLLILTGEIASDVITIREVCIRALERAESYIEKASAWCAANPGDAWAADCRYTIEAARELKEKLERALERHHGRHPRGPDRELSGLSVRECGLPPTRG